MKTILSSLKNFINSIVNFYTAHRPYFDVMQFIIGTVMIFIA